LLQLSCNRLNICVLLQVVWWGLNPYMMLYGDGTFGRRLG
jgi:hypothetical protein